MNDLSRVQDHLQSMTERPIPPRYIRAKDVAKALGIDPGRAGEALKVAIGIRVPRHPRLGYESTRVGDYLAGEERIAGILGEEIERLQTALEDRDRTIRAFKEALGLSGHEMAGERLVTALWAALGIKKEESAT